MSQSSVTRLRGPDLIWIHCNYPVLAIGLKQILEPEARVHVGRDPLDGEVPTSVVFCIEGEEDSSEGIKRIREYHPEVPVLIFGVRIDLPLARSALRAGVRGFIHAGMQPDQIARAVRVAARGEFVAPRSLLENLVTNGDAVNLNVLSSRQREILELVADGQSNAQIAKSLFLSESTIKQHLRAAYKLLGVHNRTEASKLIRNSA